ncbi:ABC transporter G family member [Trichinella spiralis]|uniref:ABC transporter G family member n=1 Tax=Trichinella spiralis TaxID=6334 RepID=A0ABR3KV67_TRISP
MLGVVSVHLSFCMLQTTVSTGLFSTNTESSEPTASTVQSSSWSAASYQPVEITVVLLLIQSTHLTLKSIFLPTFCNINFLLYEAMTEKGVAKNLHGKHTAMDSKAFLILDGLRSTLLGLCLVAAPHYLLDVILVHKSDGVHWHMARVLGGIFIAHAYLCYSWFHSTDGSTHSCILLDRLLTSALSYALCLHAQSTTNDISNTWNSESLRFLKLNFAAEIFLTSVLIVKRRFILCLFAKVCQDRLFNSLVQCDALAAVIIGSLWFALPDWLLKNQVRYSLTETHIFLSRLFGANLLSSKIYSNNVLNFVAKKDLIVWSFARSLMCLIILGGQIYSQYAYVTWWRSTHWIGIGLFSIWTVLSTWTFIRESYSTVHVDSLKINSRLFFIHSFIILLCIFGFFAKFCSQERRREIAKRTRTRKQHIFKFLITRC